MESARARRPAPHSSFRFTRSHALPAPCLARPPPRRPGACTFGPLAASHRACGTPLLPLGCSHNPPRAPACLAPPPPSRTAPPRPPCQRTVTSTATPQASFDLPLTFTFTFNPLNSRTTPSTAPFFQGSPRWQQSSRTSLASGSARSKPTPCCRVSTAGRLRACRCVTGGAEQRESHAAKPPLHHAPPRRGRMAHCAFSRAPSSSRALCRQQGHHRRPACLCLVSHLRLLAYGGGGGA